ncbi:MAG: bifunctional diguanylate cyclase/phosphodiesterase, partial [Epsilonproteobacteria bacterium]|nr:bifunctional diguanylate cyclase/phosphodiesterase [Campylobacterota bacterium]
GEVYKKLYYHPLTGLPNRVKFFEAINLKERPIVIINIDKFREINAYFGPQIGDKLIIEVAKRLKELSKKYKFKVFHLDIDEFALLFLNETTKTKLAQEIQNLFKELEEPYIIDNHEIVIKFRAGVSYFRRDYVRAEIALDKAKDLKKDIVFGEEVVSSQKDYESNLMWFKKLKKALEDDRIVPFYQPIVDGDNKIVKYEALVRLIDEDGTIVSPFYFLDIAKRSRMYLEITKRVVNKAFEKFEGREVGVSINLDLNDIEDDKMREFILEKINDSNVNVTFEIVESEDVRESSMVKNYFRILQKLGAEIYIDDFGSGYANFDYLIKLNPNGVKIDGSLVRDIMSNKNNEIIVKTIVNFAKEVGIKTVAEFVENEEIFEKLKELGVDYFQGYYFSPPKGDIDEVAK